MSEKYCMRCGETGKKKAFVVIGYQDAMQYCEECYEELLASGELIRISDEEQKKIDEDIRIRNEVIEENGAVPFETVIEMALAMVNGSLKKRTGE